MRRCTAPIDRRMLSGMQLAPAATTDVIPWPPMRTFEDALVGLERGMATAGVAWMSPDTSDPAQLRAVANVVVEAAAIIERATAEHPTLDLPVAARQARDGAARLTQAAHLLEQVVDPTPPGGDPFAPVSMAAEAAFRSIKSAYLTAGGG